MKRRLIWPFMLWLCACGEEIAPPSDPCEPAAPDASLPFAADADAIDEANAVAARFMAEHPDPGALLWDWGEGVFMLSLVDLHRVSGVAAQRDYYRAWIDHYLDVGYEHLLVSSDRCPPALTALALYRQTCDADYRGIVDRTLTYLYDEALRTEDGGINHLGTQDTFGVSLWLDSLFMFGNLFIRWGEHADDAGALDAYHEQFLIFAGHLQDDSGWFVHAHDWPIGQQDPDVFWGRGNAWVTAATYEYLRVRKARGESDPEIEAAIAKQVEAIVAAQDPASGLWWTVVNRPGDSYLETSASALFAVGLSRGYRYGFLGAEVLPAIEAAMQGVRANIADGVVGGISGPTTVGDFDHYASIEVDDNIHYGVGAAIVALIETSNL